jgi:phosphoglycolate phosphatase
MPIRRLLLWDIDGTLLSAGPAAREAFHFAVGSVLGRHVADGDVSMSGKTDPQIALEILASMAVAEPEARNHLPAVLRALEERLHEAAETIRRDGRLHPGVAGLLERLHGRPEVLQSVLTGNVKANALLKVGAFGLDRYLDLEIGAFGSDSEDRSDLAAIAMRKAATLRRFPAQPGQTWVIGDTPRDLAAAQSVGAHCFLVATGRIPYGELAELGADAVFQDLTDMDAVEGLLGLSVQ